jgi:hypothetical protein
MAAFSLLVAANSTGVVADEARKAVAGASRVSSHGKMSRWLGVPIDPSPLVRFWATIMPTDISSMGPFLGATIRSLTVKVNPTIRGGGLFRQAAVAEIMGTLPTPAA